MDALQHIKNVIKELEGPFDGTEGLDSYTLGYAIALLEELPALKGKN